MRGRAERLAWSDVQDALRIGKGDEIKPSPAMSLARGDADNDVIVRRREAFAKRQPVDLSTIISKCGDSKKRPAMSASTRPCPSESRGRGSNSAPYGCRRKSEAEGEEAARLSHAV